MPSVMHTISLMPASAASRIASAAKAAGTKIMLTSAPVSRTAAWVVEHRHAEVLGTAAPGRDPGNDLRAVLDALFGVEGTLPARQALTDDTRVLVDENAHE